MNDESNIPVELIVDRGMLNPEWLKLGGRLIEFSEDDYKCIEVGPPPKPLEE